MGCDKPSCSSSFLSSSLSLADHKLRGRSSARATKRGSASCPITRHTAILGRLAPWAGDLLLSLTAPPLPSLSILLSFLPFSSVSPIPLRPQHSQTSRTLDLDFSLNMMRNNPHVGSEPPLHLVPEQTTEGDRGQPML